MTNLTRQVAAWRTSWQRLAWVDEAARQAFLRKIGEHLGEQDAEAAVRRGRIVLGIGEAR